MITKKLRFFLSEHSRPLLSFFIWISLFLGPLKTRAEYDGLVVKWLDNFYSLLQSAIGVAVGLAVLYFVWGLTAFIYNAPEKLAEGRKRMYWGVIAFFVLTSIWGLIRFLNVAFFGVPVAPY